MALQAECILEGTQKKWSSPHYSPGQSQCHCETVAGPDTSVAHMLVGEKKIYTPYTIKKVYVQQIAYIILCSYIGLKLPSFFEWLNHFLNLNKVKNLSSRFHSLNILEIQG